MSALTPGRPFPSIDLPRVGGGRVTNASLDAPYMTVLNVYRGLHCPRCHAQFDDFLAHRGDLDEAGVKIVSISTDPQDRAEQAVAEWGLGDLVVGHDLGIQHARDLGLFISEAIREGETAQFAEAAVFFIRPDGVLWGSSINSFPFLRPTAAMILDAIATAKSRNYPPRGNLAA
ncbi:MAG: redoxin domain-containing protein [Pseudomonadota bacterium]